MNMDRTGARLALASCLLLALGAGCSHTSSGGEEGFATQAAEELAASGFGDYLGVQSPSSSSQRGEWTEYFYDPAEEGAVCLTGEQFQVNVRKGSTDDVLLYMQGGGACWDYLTCYVLGTATTGANGAVESGALDINDPDSPFKDWNIVYLPYCDGSVFTGDATVDYNGRRTFHHGLRNLSAGVDAIKRDFPNASRIVVAGSSAGGYGTFAGYGVTRVAFPAMPILILNDSGPGLQNLDASQDVKDRTVNWNFTRRIPPSCTECQEQYTYLIDWSLDRDSKLRTALYSYQQDGVISFFIDLDGPDYQQLLLSVTGDVHARNPERFQRFFPLGTSHTVLLGPEFYTQTVNGVSLLDWTNAFLADGPGWDDTIE